MSSIGGLACGEHDIGIFSAPGRSISFSIEYETQSPEKQGITNDDEEI